jgi:ech hydrogenase subunit F
MAHPSILKLVTRAAVSKYSTRLYPFTKRQAIAGSRGHIEIDVAKCIYCGLCVKRCPTAALTVSKPQRTWAINRFACVQCGGCTEVCPKKCLTLASGYTQPAPKKGIESFKGPQPTEKTAE